MIWKTVVNNGEHHPEKGQQGFKKKPSKEKVSKVITVRLTEEQIDLIKKSMHKTPYDSISDLTRAAIGQYLYYNTEV